MGLAVQLSILVPTLSGPLTLSALSGPLAQAELLKPPQPGQSADSWLLWAMVSLVFSMVAALLALVGYLIRTFLPDILGRLERKDQQMAATIQNHEESCEARAKHRSEVHAKEMAEARKDYLNENEGARKDYLSAIDDLLATAFHEGDVDRVKRLRRRRSGGASEEATA